MTVFVTIGRVFFNSLAGYALARLHFRGRGVIFAALVGVMSVPAVVLLIPKFLVIKQLGMYDSFAGMILPLLVDAAGVFIMKNFFESIPASVEEQARIDGAGSFRLFWSVVLPMARPALITIIIMSFQGSWNELSHFIVASQSPELVTLTKGVAMLSSGQLSQGTHCPLGGIGAGVVHRLHRVRGEGMTPCQWGEIGGVPSSGLVEADVGEHSGALPGELGPPLGLTSQIDHGSPGLWCPGDRLVETDPRDPPADTQPGFGAKPPLHCPHRDTGAAREFSDAAADGEVGHDRRRHGGGFVRMWLGNHEHRYRIRLGGDDLCCERTNEVGACGVVFQIAEVLGELEQESEPEPVRQHSDGGPDDGGTRHVDGKFNGNDHRILITTDPVAQACGNECDLPRRQCRCRRRRLHARCSGVDPHDECPPGAPGRALDRASTDPLWNSHRFFLLPSVSPTPPTVGPPREGC